MMREMDFVDECYADKDLSLLKKLTLVIPTYNRNYYLSRCLWYHAHFPFGVWGKYPVPGVRAGDRKVRRGHLPKVGGCSAACGDGVLCELC